ncbi:MAG: hypothetical protein IJ661_06400 [Lachnospiraceae bacterium]|nr:hypothetical protein [Lachnospiraceae bacterium]
MSPDSDRAMEMTIMLMIRTLYLYFMVISKVYLTVLKDTGDGSLSPHGAITAMGFGLQYREDTENRTL